MNLKTLLASATATESLGLAAAVPAQEATSTDTMPANAQPGPALWKVADEDTTIYLVGTVHVLPDDIDWFDSRIANAFGASDELVFEIDMEDTAAMQQVVTQRAVLEGDQTLRELMTEENRAQYEQALANFGMPAATLDQMEPWMAAMTLSILPLVASGYNTEAGVETALNTRAEGKTRGSLETIDEQIALFDTLPMEVQLTYLDDTVEAIPETPANIERMVGRWLEGDAVSLAAIMNEEMDDPALYHRLLTDRNANWANWIEQRLDSEGTVFVAVGAGHLAGRGSVQEMLEERGLEVTRIWE